MSETNDNREVRRLLLPWLLVFAGLGWGLGRWMGDGVTVPSPSPVESFESDSAVDPASVPTIAGPQSPVSVGGLAIFRLPETVRGTAGNWSVDARAVDIDDPPREEIAVGDGAAEQSVLVVDTSTPCTYVVRTAGDYAGRPINFAAAFEVVAAVPLPPKPGPVEPVEPDEKPVAKAKRLLIVVVDLFEQRTLDQAAVLTDVDYWNGVRKKGHELASLDAATEDAAPYVGYGVPMVVVVDADGRKELGHAALPEKKVRQFMDGLIKRYAE